MTTVHGTVEPGFEGVRDALANNLASGADVGASACVTVDGQVVADVWGGHLDREATKEWQQDTIINVWSTTKTMAALSALVLADRGDLDLHAPVARYWPEFKEGGKGGGKGGCGAPPHPQPHRRPLGLAGADGTVGPVRLGEGDLAARGTGAVVG